MRRKRSISLAVVFALGALAAVIVPSAPAAAAVNEVTNWNRIATTTLVQFPPLAGGAPPALQINMGMVQGAVYDAVNAIEPMHEPYLLQTTFASTASKEAAVATAAYTVLTNIIAGVPDTVPFPPGTVSFPNEPPFRHPSRTPTPLRSPLSLAASPRPTGSPPGPPRPTR